MGQFTTILNIITLKNLLPVWEKLHAFKLWKFFYLQLPLYIPKNILIHFAYKSIIWNCLTFVKWLLKTSTIAFRKFKWNIILDISEQPISWYRLYCIVHELGQTLSNLFNILSYPLCILECATKSIFFFIQNFILWTMNIKINCNAVTEFLLMIQNFSIEKIS